MKKLIAAAAVVISGCASYTADQINTPVARGDCAGAEAVAGPRAQRGDSNSVYNLGYIAEACRRDRASAVSYYTLAARMGNDLARVSLARLGETVPDADLVRRSDPNDAALGLMLLQAARPKPMPMPMPQSTVCRTVPVGGGWQTVCN